MAHESALSAQRFIVVTWVAGTEIAPVQRVLRGALANAEWRVLRDSVDDALLDVFVDATSAEEAARIRMTVSELISRVGGATVDGQWIFPVG